MGWFSNGKVNVTTLLGYYHANNLGDDFFCHLFLNELRSRGHKVFVPTASTLLRNSLGVTDNPPLRKAIDLSSNVVIGGGGLLGAGSLAIKSAGKEFAFYKKVALYCRVMRKRLYFLGVGVGPFLSSGQERDVRKIIEMADVVTIRDEKSMQFVEHLSPRLTKKVQLLSDPAYLYEPQMLPLNVTPFSIAKPTMGINLTGSSSFGKGLSADVAAREVIEAVKQLVCEGAVKSVVWFSTTSSGHELRWACRGMAELPDVSRLVIYDNDIWPWLSRLRECQTFLSMKLHSGVFAALSGARLMGIGYHPKIERFYKDINALEYYRSLAQVEAGDVLSFVKTKYPGVAVDHIYPIIKERKELASKIFDFLPVAMKS